MGLQCSELAAVGDYELGLCLAALGALFLHFLDHVIPFHHFAKHHVLPVEPAEKHQWTPLVDATLSKHEEYILTHSRKWQ